MMGVAVAVRFQVERDRRTNIMENCKCTARGHDHPDYKCDSAATTADGYCRKCSEKIGKATTDAEQFGPKSPMGQ